METGVTWLKSTRSKEGGQCVELASTLDQLRDSKDPAGPTLVGDMAVFVRAVKSGRFDG